MASVYHRRSSSVVLTPFWLGLIVLLLAVAMGAVSGQWFSNTFIFLSAVVGAMIMAWSISNIVAFFVGPRRLAFDGTRVTYGRKSLTLNTLRSIQLNHSWRILRLRFQDGGKWTIRLPFWVGGDEIYGRFVESLRAFRGPETDSQLACDGRITFGKITAFADRLEFKKFKLPYADIVSIRTRTTVTTWGGPEKTGKKIEYMVVTLRNGRLYTIHRDTIINEPLLLDFLSRRLPE